MLPNALTWSSLSGWPSVTSSLVTVNDGTVGQQVVGVRADRAVEGHRWLLRTVEVSTNVFRALAVVTGAVPLRDDGHVEQPPPYPSGLSLAGRRVLVVGGGHVAQRRVPQLIAAGADVVSCRRR